MSEAKRWIRDSLLPPVALVVSIGFLISLLEGHGIHWTWEVTVEFLAVAFAIGISQGLYGGVECLGVPAPLVFSLVMLGAANGLMYTALAEAGAFFMGAGVAGVAEFALSVGRGIGIERREKRTQVSE